MSSKAETTPRVGNNKEGTEELRRIISFDMGSVGTDENLRGRRECCPVVLAPLN